MSSITSIHVTPASGVDRKYNAAVFTGSYRPRQFYTVTIQELLTIIHGGDAVYAAGCRVNWGNFTSLMQREYVEDLLTLHNDIDARKVGVAGAVEDAEYPQDQLTTMQSAPRTPKIATVEEVRYMSQRSVMAAQQSPDSKAVPLDQQATALFEYYASLGLDIQGKSLLEVTQAYTNLMKTILS